MTSTVTVPRHLRLQVKRSTQTHPGQTGLVLSTQKRIMNEMFVCLLISYTIMSWDSSRHVFGQRLSTCILRSVWFPSETCLQNLQTVVEHRMPLCYWWHPADLKDVQVFPQLPLCGHCFLAVLKFHGATEHFTAVKLWFISGMWSMCYTFARNSSRKPFWCTLE